jgi:hypothetical protein
MGKGNNNQQRFQGAAQPPQGQQDEQPKTSGAPIGDHTAAGDAASQSDTDVVQSSTGDAGTSPATGVSEVGDQAGGSDSGATTEVVGAASLVPEHLTAIHEELVEIETIAAAEISPFAGGLLHSLEEYAELMNPRRPTSAAEGVSCQRRLFRALKSIINDLDGNDFDTVFGNLLAMIEKNTTGAFADLAMFRHLEAKELNLVPADRRSFRDMVNFLLKIAPLQSRTTVARQVNLNATFAGAAFSEEGRQRVQNYCHIG